MYITELDMEAGQLEQDFFQGKISAEEYWSRVGEMQQEWMEEYYEDDE